MTGPEASVEADNGARLTGASGSELGAIRLTLGSRDFSVTTIGGGSRIIMLLQFALLFST